VSDKEAYASSDELLDRAVRAINLGDRKTADALAGRIRGRRWQSDAEGYSHPETAVRSGACQSSRILSIRRHFRPVEIEVYRTVVGGIATR
jgi:hypothetical protein